MQKSYALEVHNVTVHYRDIPILYDINCVVPQGVLCALIGPNGAGKTTLLKTILQLERSLAGSITLIGKPYSTMRSHVAYIPQRATIDWDFPATVFDVVMMGRYHLLGWFARPQQKDHICVYDALEQVGMSAYAHTHIGNLSGGQQQRVFLARALVQEADIFFMDEPFIGIDMATEKIIITLLKRMCADGKTVIVVHHDLQTLYDYFNYVVLLNKTIISYGPLDIALTEQSIYHTFGRSLSLIDYKGMSL